jgi:hypothetical protein
LVHKISKALRAICRKLDIILPRSAENGVYLFPYDIAEQFMRNHGIAWIKEHNDTVTGQSAFNLRKSDAENRDCKRLRPPNFSNFCRGRQVMHRGCRNLRGMALGRQLFERISFGR